MTIDGEELLNNPNATIIDTKVKPSTKIDKDTVNATLVFRNVKLDFIHMLVFKTPMNDIFKKDGTLYAELYTNIPQSDIRNLFPNPKNYRYKR